MTTIIRKLRAPITAQAVIQAHLTAKAQMQTQVHLMIVVIQALQMAREIQVQIPAIIQVEKAVLNPLRTNNYGKAK